MTVTIGRLRELLEINTGLPDDTQVVVVDRYGIDEVPSSIDIITDVKTCTWDTSTLLSRG